MSYDTLFLIKDIVIVLLVFAIIVCVRKIRDLKKSLTEEKRKRSMPILLLDVNTNDDPGVFLINDSYCYAKNIRIGDLDVIVDYGFKKHVTLKFEPLAMLKPNARIKLNYRVFDDQFDTTASDAQNILNHFSDSPLEMHLRYENIEGGPFRATIISDHNEYLTKDVTAINENSR